ncbi:hypothetical protein [Streptomyces sp. NPDC017940]|uniref:hypothetical protein n=1 Tax=Streptomyces sp. NPDC017940 TaxID=3365017 RepID=UPI00378B8A77
MTPEEAYQSTIHGRIPHEITNFNDIQLAVAPRLIRPMLYDLARTGRWQRHRHGYYRLTDNLDCHVFSWDATGTEIQRYNAGHSEHQCPRPHPPREPRAHFPHVHDTPALPPPGTPHGWRGLLREATDLPLTFLGPALNFYGRYRFGYDRLTPANFATIFYAMADQAAEIHERMLYAPGHHFISDQHGLIWDIATRTECRHATKPAVTGIYPPYGRPADHPGHQRANRAPGSSTLATRKRPQ